MSTRDLPQRLFFGRPTTAIRPLRRPPLTGPKASFPGAPKLRRGVLLDGYGDAGAMSTMRDRSRMRRLLSGGGSSPRSPVGRIGDDAYPRHQDANVPMLPRHPSFRIADR